VPIRNNALAPNFLFDDIFNFQTRANGIKSIAQSEARLKDPTVRTYAEKFTHLPLIVGSHIMAMGTHWKSETKNAHVNHSMFSQVKASRALRRFDRLIGANILVN
jgi:hypothetical protein